MQTNLFVSDHNLQNRHLTFKGNHKLSRHAWIRLTPAYSIELVEQIIEAQTKPKTVLDPFNGSGTTTTVCAIKGIDSTGVEINPFLAWLANIKAAKYAESDLRTFTASIKEIDESLVSFSKNAWTPKIFKIERWWDSPILYSLAGIFSKINHNAITLSPAVTDLLKVTYCRTLMQVSNASFGHQSMSFSKKREQKQINVVSTFKENAKFIQESIEKEEVKSLPKILNGNSREIGSLLPHNTFDLVITSPPYPNRISYIRELRPYLYWLGYLENGRQAGELDWAAIGGTWGIATSNLTKWNPPDKPHIPELTEIANNINKESPILSKYVEKYFYDMNIHVRQLFDVVAKKGQVNYIVGNSKFYDTILPVEELFESLFKNAGFEYTRIEKIRKRSSKKELYEFLVCAQKP